MKFLLLLIAAVVASGQSNPSWWKYAPPEATALVGLQWKQIQATPFGPALAAELAPGGSLGFPNLELLRTPEQIVIGSPTLLAIESGTFPIATLRAQAEAKGFQRSAFKSAELYVSSDPAALSVAYISEKLLLVGSRKAIEDAISRIANPKERSFSPLLARAARYSKEDLWVVASGLPNPLASQFLPIEIEATAFEGSVSIWDGLHMVASVERPSPTQALDFADSLAERLASRPAMAEGTEITTRDRSVFIRMELNEQQLAASLRSTPTAPLTPRDPHDLVSAVAPAKPQPRAFVPPTQTPAANKQTPGTLTVVVPDVTLSAPEPQTTPRTVLLPPPPPRTIKIIGLDSGPREIPLGH